MIRTQWQMALCGLCMGLSLVSCGSLTTNQRDTIVTVESPIVWPPAPNLPRVRFVKSISTLDDLGVTKNFFQKFAEFIFGGDDISIARPTAVVASGSYLYVADTSIQGVHRFNLGQNEYDLIHLPDNTPLPSPVGLALGANGDVYVTDSVLAQVFIIKMGAKFATPLNLQATFKSPTGIAVDNVTGRVFVVDTMDHRIYVFNQDGTLDKTIGQRGIEAGEFNYPTLIWRSSKGLLYVTDSMNFRIQIFDNEGKLFSKFGRQGDTGGDAARQKGVATDSYGHIYVVDALFHAIKIYDPSGQYLMSVGNLGSEKGEFWLPTGIFIGEDDMIYVADSYNRRVQVLRYIGGPT